MSRTRRRKHKAQIWVKWGVKNRIIADTERSRDFWWTGIYLGWVKVPRSQQQARRWRNDAIIATYGQIGNLDVRGPRRNSTPAFHPATYGAHENWEGGK